VEYPFKSDFCVSCASYIGTLLTRQWTFICLQNFTKIGPLKIGMKIYPFSKHVIDISMN